MGVKKNKDMQKYLNKIREELNMDSVDSVLALEFN